MEHFTCLEAVIKYNLFTKYSLAFEFFQYIHGSCWYNGDPPVSSMFKTILFSNLATSLNRDDGVFAAIETIGDKAPKPTSSLAARIFPIQPWYHRWIEGSGSTRHCWYCVTFKFSSSFESRWRNLTLFRDSPHDLFTPWQSCLGFYTQAASRHLSWVSNIFSRGSCLCWVCWTECFHDYEIHGAKMASLERVLKIVENMSLNTCTTLHPPSLVYPLATKNEKYTYENLGTKRTYPRKWKLAVFPCCLHYIACTMNGFCWVYSETVYFWCGNGLPRYLVGFL